MRQETKQRWERVLREFEASGLSAARFCARRGLALSTFYAARRGVRRRRRGEVGQDAPAFVEAVLTEDQACLIVECRGGRRIMVPRGFDERTLARVVAALEHEEMPGGAHAHASGARS